MNNCIYWRYACGEGACEIGKGRKNKFGYEHSYPAEMCKDCRYKKVNET